MLLAFALSALAMPAAAQAEDPQAAAQRAFQDNKFGIFLHWGLYSLMAQGEWYMTHQNIDRREYEKFASAFYPSRFDAARWVAALKAAGARYLCFTARHHDGFSMFRTAASPYNIVEATPYGRDVLKELADECRRQGLRLHIYYSLIDWTRDDAPRGQTGRGTGRPAEAADTAGYFAFMTRQLSELLTNYGDVGALWFDGAWDMPEGFDWQTDRIYRLIHERQPACLIGNNHHRTPLRGEGFQLFERDLPGENKAGFSEGQTVSLLPLETCETINRTWGYKADDQAYKSPRELIALLVGAAGRNANLLLNIGPQPNGELPEQALARLKEVGDWLNTYGETIYGTRGGLIDAQEWGTLTQKGKRLFVHITRFDGDTLRLPLTQRVKSAATYIGRAAVPFRQDRSGLTLALPPRPDAPDFVVELHLK